jgi:CRP/FNR family cyclic AMP-dependent transcriptional regulator
VDSKEQLIRSVPLFAELSKEELKEVVRLVDEVDVDAGRVLIEEGATGGECFVVVEGRVEVRRDGEPIAEAGPGDVLGELALLDRKPRNASAVAVEPTRLLVLARTEFHSLMNHQPAVRSKVEAAAGERRLPAAGDAPTA